MGYTAAINNGWNEKQKIKKELGKIGTHWLTVLLKDSAIEMNINEITSEMSILNNDNSSSSSDNE